jgi:hypothetical protein
MIKIDSAPDGLSVMSKLDNFKVKKNESGDILPIPQDTESIPAINPPSVEKQKEQKKLSGRFPSYQE